MGDYDHLEGHDPAAEEEIDASEPKAAKDTGEPAKHQAEPKHATKD